MNNALHENETYRIQVNDAGDKYLVINKDSSVIESEVQMLPDAVSIAEQSNAYLLHKTWQWIRRQSESDKETAEEHLATPLEASEIN